MKVLHVLESSVPDTGGYTIRARAIIEHQRRIGLDPVVVTSPLFPSKHYRDRTEVIDGIRHHRTNYIAAPSTVRFKPAAHFYRLLMMYRYRQALLRIVAQEKPDIIHAHSSYSNAHAAFPAAKKYNLPLVYEVRTLWGESAVVEDGLRTDSWKYHLVWKLELDAMRRADAVIPIASGIKDELIRRGVDGVKMTVVPNGVDSNRFVATARDEALLQKHGLAGKFVIGFIGSMRRLEGLSTLVEAYAKCRELRDDIRVVIVGDGPDKPDLEKLALRLGVADIVFAGNVAHQDVALWYSVMDALAYPRIRATINERVTPLKPLEAMALGKVCIGSDVGGLIELIRDGDTGVIFPSGDSDALAQRLMALADDRAQLDRLGLSANAYVKRERDWSQIIPRTRELYERLVQAKRGSQHV